MINFTGVKAVAIPEGNVSMIIRQSDSALRWKKLIGDLPFPYQQVEYITMNGSQGIIYKELFTDKNELNFVFSPTDFPMSYVGGTYTKGSKSYMTMVLMSKKIYSYVGDPSVNTSTMSLNAKYSLTVKVDNTTLKQSLTFESEGSVLASQNVDITKVDESSSQLLKYGVGCNGYLASGAGGVGRFDGNGCFVGKVYSYQHTSNGELVRNFLPCYRITDGAVGMYDTVTKTFYTNDGEGEFAKGPDVTDTPFIPRLPNEYQELRYIAVNGTQYIDTNWVPTNNTLFKIKVLHATGYMWGSGSYPRLAAVHNTNSITIYNTTNATDGIYTFSQATDAISNIETYSTSDNTTDTYVALNGEETRNNVAAETSFNTALHMLIGAWQYNASTVRYGNGKIYYAMAEVEGIKVFELIPCYRKSDGVIGMYDLVSGTLFTNAGTGTFTMGPEVNE